MNIKTGDFEIFTSNPLKEFIVVTEKSDRFNLDLM